MLLAAWKCSEAALSGHSGGAGSALSGWNPSDRGHPQRVKPECPLNGCCPHAASPVRAYQTCSVQAATQRLFPNWSQCTRRSGEMCMRDAGTTETLTHHSSANEMPWSMGPCSQTQNLSVSHSEATNQRPSSRLAFPAVRSGCTTAKVRQTLARLTFLSGCYSTGWRIRTRRVVTNVPPRQTTLASVVRIFPRPAPQSPTPDLFMPTEPGCQLFNGFWSVTSHRLKSYTDRLEITI